MSRILLFKSQLQEYAQKASLPLPVYETANEGPAHDPKFKATVIVNGARYDSTSSFHSIKAAEQSSAQVALEDLLKKLGQEKDVSRRAHKTGLCKNLLQAYTQKMSLPFPVYKCTRSGESHPLIFTSTVQVGDVFYTGGVANSRKEAEIKAAQKALMAIQIEACDSISQAGTENISVLKAANPNTSSSQDLVSNICSQAGEDSQIKRDRDKELSREGCTPVIPKQSPATDSLTREDESPKNETGLCKTLLQVYAQRIGLPVPVYRSTRSGEIHLPVFISTVEFPGISYTGGAANTKKEAEIKAAKQALMELQPQGDFISQTAVQDISHSQAAHSNLLSSQVPIFRICSQSGEDSQRKRSREMEVTSEGCKAIKLKKSASISQSTPKDQALKNVKGLYKNLLQEYTQKLNLALPVYTFSMSGEVHSPIFTSTVQVSGVAYNGGIANSKKEAASKAAQKALAALQSQACDSACQAAAQNILGCQALNQDTSGSPVNISNNFSEVGFSQTKRDTNVDTAIEMNAVKLQQSTSDAGA